MIRKLITVIAALSVVAVGFVGAAQAHEKPVCIDNRQQEPIDEFASSPDLMEIVEFKKDSPQYPADSLADDLAERGREHGEEVSDCAGEDQQNSI